MTKTCKKFPLTILQLILFPQTVLNLFYQLKKCHKNLFWQSIKCFPFCILAYHGRPGRSNQENCHGWTGLVGNIPTLHDSRRDNESCWPD